MPAKCSADIISHQQSEEARKPQETVPPSMKSLRLLIRFMETFIQIRGIIRGQREVKGLLW
jgi:hypothetical protein